MLNRGPREKTIAYVGYALITLAFFAVFYLYLVGTLQTSPGLKWLIGALLVAGIVLRLLSELIRVRAVARARNAAAEEAARAHKPLITPDTFPPEGPVL